MSQRYFTEDHEWVEVNDNIATIGISSHAVDELGEIVFVELPNVGSVIEKSDEFASVESVKTVSGIYSPISGEIIEVNSSIVDSPEVINNSPYESGWLVKVKSASFDSDDLMDESAYQTFLNGL